MDSKSLGSKGERMAVRFLEKKGYRILEKNYHKRTGEIDIIAFDPDFGETVFVEVKTRRNTNFGYPEEAVDQRKLDKMTKTAQMWLAENKKENTEWRLDVITLVKQENDQFSIEHLPNVG